MPVAFRDADELYELGCAGYLRVLPTGDGNCFLGALFIVNARGEPMEFVYNRIGIPHTFLWRSADIRRFATEQLAGSLLKKCSVVPLLLLCLEDETDRNLFGRDFKVSVPVCLVRGAGGSASENLRAPLSWVSDQPVEGSPAWNLSGELGERGLLEEPFERAAIGLQQVYSEKPAI